MEMRERIKELRKTIGLTQGQFAKRIAIVASYISEIESGVRKINERAVRLIIAEYNVNEAWLRHGKGAMFVDNVNPLLSEAIIKFKSLDPIFQEDALRILTVLGEMNDKAKSVV